MDIQVSASDSATSTDYPVGSYGVPVAVSASDSGVAFDYLAGGVGGPVVDSAIVSDAASCALYLGRYRRGDKVPLYLALASTPDAVPIAIILDSDSNQIASLMMPAVDNPRTIFTLPLPIGLVYGIGSFSAYYHYVVDGSPALQQATFDVIPGGDSGGNVVALYSIDRIESRCVVAQLDSGVLVLGKTPTAQA